MARSKNGELARTAQDLVERGFAVHGIGRAKRPSHSAGYLTRPAAEISSETLEQIASGRAHGIAIELGERGARQVDGATLAPFALELEGRATADPAFMAEWDDALASAGLENTLRDVAAGWSERTPSGGLRWLMQVRVTDRAMLETLLHSLQGGTTKRAGAVYGEMLTRSSIVAPSGGQAHKEGGSWVRLAGGPTTCVTVSVTDLIAFADLLVRLSDPPAGTPVGGAGAGLDPRTAEVRAAYNRHHASDAQTIALLEGHGWSVTSVRDGGETVLHRDGHSEVRVGGPARPAGSLWTWKPSAAPLPSEQLVTGFDALLLLNTNPTIPTATAADLAAWLATPEPSVDKPLVQVAPRVLAPRERREVYPETTPTTQLTQELVHALTTARHPITPDLPFALRQGESLVLVGASGGVSIHPRRALDSLALSVVQPVRETQNGTRFLHSLPRAVTEMAAQVAVAEGGLTNVRHIVSCPVVAPDGTVLSDPGLYPQFETLVAIPRPERAMWAQQYSVPQSPSRADAQAALDLLLRELLCDFPFVTPGDRARAVAYVLTVAGRNLASAVPMFAFSAPDRGTGKTKLARLPRYLATGAGTAQSIGFEKRADEEIRKAIVAATLRALPYLHVDEVPREHAISSLVLSELVTAEDGATSFRVLGGNDSVSIMPSVVTVCGNNLKLGADFNRRTLPIHLGLPEDSAVLAQDRDGFRHPHLERYVLAHRPELLAACHAILAAGLARPVPDSALPRGFGSFEGWKRVIVGALVGLTIKGKDASELIIDGRAEWETSQDEEGADWLPFMQAWHALGEEWFKTGDIRGKITSIKPAIELPAPLVMVSGQGDAGAVRAWARVLKSRTGTAVRRLDGIIYRLHLQDDPKRGARFRVTAVPSSASTGRSAPNSPAAPSAPPQPRPFAPPTRPTPPPPAVDADLVAA